MDLACVPLFTGFVGYLLAVFVLGDGYLNHCKIS